MNNAVLVQAHWDTTDAANAGWYAVTYQRDEHGEMYEANDSMKVWFPVDLDVFAEDDSSSVFEALSEAFPESEIVIR